MISTKRQACRRDGAAVARQPLTLARQGLVSIFEEHGPIKRAIVIKVRLDSVIVAGNNAD